jgi:hypothetical protein
MTTATRLDRALVAATVGFLERSGVRGREWDQLPLASAPTLIVGCGALYGAVMASFNGLGGERDWMIFYGAMKIPLLFLATLLLAVPSFYVVNLVFGVGDDFKRVWRGLVDYQIAVSLQLLALAPATVFVNLTNGDYRTVQAWSSLMFAGAAWNARRSLANVYAPLIAANPVHRHLQRTWFLLYAFVGIQMGWDLRPFVGSPDMQVQFFRADIGNAYKEIFAILAEAARGMF